MIPLTTLGSSILIFSDFFKYSTSSWETTNVVIEVASFI